MLCHRAGLHPARLEPAQPASDIVNIVDDRPVIARVRRGTSEIVIRRHIHLPHAPGYEFEIVRGQGRRAIRCNPTVHDTDFRSVRLRSRASLGQQAQSHEDIEHRPAGRTGKPRRHFNRISKSNRH